MDTVKGYYNPKFQQDLQNNVYFSTNYAYTIEQENDGRGPYWELTITTTSLAEIDGHEEGIIDHYQYITKENAVSDIETAQELTEIIFEEI